MNDRLMAHKILMKVFSRGQSLTQALASAPESSAFSKSLAFGVCRQYFRLNCILDALLRKKNSNIALKLCLLIGLYQLLYTRKAKHAVVKETVAMLDGLKLGWAKGLANAILRGFDRDGKKLLEVLENDRYYQTGHPSWMVAQWQQDWPARWETIIAENDKQAPMALRVNLAKTSREDYVQRLAAAGMQARVLPDIPSALVLEKPCPVEELPGFREGMVSVQDVTAQRAAILLDPQPGQRVLDACCAPGGKTCHILEQQSQLGECLAIDVDANRLPRVTENLERLKLHTHLQMADAAHPEQWWDGRHFDRILLDAPCTASGVIRRQPDIRIHRSAEDLGRITILQKEILYALWPLLAPGGRLLYVTCSVFKRENTQQMEKFVDEHADAKPLPLSFEFGEAQTCGWQFFPGDAWGDGFYYALIEKKPV